MKNHFPGTECLNQLKLIANVVGSMSDADIGFINNPKSCRYIKSLPYTADVPLANLYHDANPLAIDLLQKMLVFYPSKRISVTEAVQHRYMSTLYNPSANRPAEVPIDLDINENLGEDTIREMIWKEILYYHPEANVYDPLLVLISASTLACNYKNLQLFSCGRSLVSS
ncbi:atmpk7, mpk7 atmpk7 (map kinase 7) [Musa troglodytarum]|uniref:Atmpk7, mpk7 atmpk7 (Map kinase 7) n=1 Tax=Musa troglodytarum TaxID=320322 RepID=A0A9E7L3N5_9LILI|nr:atmpk7, mpk7 atmpk7 (map kinase 7) [Musa troglodytarum]